MTDEEAAEPLDGEQVLALIGKHSTKLAALASDREWMTLYYFLKSAAEQAERQLVALREAPEGSVS